MSSDDENYNSDEEINPKDHSKLIQDIVQLDKKQYVKKPTRTEPALQVSEFNLVRPNESKISLKDLTKSLEKKRKLNDVTQKVKSLKVKTLEKPLEKPQRERIKRSIGFQEVKLDLAKWDPIVIKNRVSIQQHFPLDDGGSVEIRREKKHQSGFKLAIKTDLDKELDAIEAEYKPAETEEVVEAFPLTLKEIMEKRREMARLRAHQSYREAKAHRQNKIKSKKFHRIKRQEKVKNQLKAFEKLQETDPEQALRKLDELDKTRAEERMSLRHRSTGQWAKNKQIRAKYDKESRQILAEQLALSRQLTKKTKRPDDSSTDSSDDENAVGGVGSFDPSNPWVKSVKTESEIDEFLTGYRKYWDEKNKNNETDTNTERNKTKTVKKLKNTRIETKIDSGETKSDSSEAENGEVQAKNETVDQIGSKMVESDSTDEENEESDSDSIVTRSMKRTNDTTSDENVKQVKKNRKKSSDEAKVLKSLSLSGLLRKKLTKPSKKRNTVKCTSEWEIETLTPADDEQEIQEMFEELETVTKNRLKTKLNAMKENVNKPVREPKVKPNRKKVTTKRLKNKDYLELPREKTRPEIDEELIASIDDEDKPKTKRYFPKETDTQTGSNTNIDPNRFLNVRPTELDTLLPDGVTFGDNEDPEVEQTQKALITEAFEGDDVVAEFQKEKQQVIDKDKPEEVDLNLPGWGTWGGKDIKPSKRKTKRFIRRFPKKIPRRDENKGNLIVYESKNERLKKHLPSEVPFPFKTVKDFESSIRAPVGDTFVPQTAFRRLIKPSVTTKTGEVIKPMDEDVLLNYKLTKNGMVVKR